MDQPLINLQDISKSYHDDNLNISVFESLSFSVNSDELITIVGPNGCGKTSLLNLIAGTIKPETGTVSVESKSNNERPTFGYVWQNYENTLLPWYSAAENIVFPLRISGRYDKKEIQQKLDVFLSDFKLDFDLNKKVYHLSGGQKQLVSLFRSTIIEPDVLLMDEPFSALDQPKRWNMAFYVESIWSKLKVPTLVVSHDIDEALLLGQKIILISKKLKGIKEILENDNPRPRSISDLTSGKHIHLREKIIKFLQEEGEIIDNKESIN